MYAHTRNELALNLSQFPHTPTDLHADVGAAHMLYMLHGLQQRRTNF